MEKTTAFLHGEDQSSARNDTEQTDEKGAE